MNGLIRSAISFPIAVGAVVLAMVIFGVASLRTIPIQLTPDIDRPILQVRVNWPGASPQDVERDIVLRLERELSSLSGVQSIESTSRRGSARVTLTYAVGTDMDNALVKLLGQLSRVSDLPAEATEPTVRTSNSDDSPIARMAMVPLPGKTVDVDTLGSFIERNVIEPLARIPGIAEIDSNGGADRELRVILNMARLTDFGLSIAEVAEALRNSTAEVSAGELTEGRRSFTLRTEAISYTPETARSLVLRTTVRPDGSLAVVRLQDVADVELGFKTASSFRRLNGQKAATFSVLREPASNVVATLDALKAQVAELNAGPLLAAGVVLKVVYDETMYISSALDLVQSNILIGGILAVSILLLFLRSFLPVAIVMIAIPVSIVTTFVAIAALGLSINVISLAGLAFAVGMVVDASIVSLENIYRLRQNGVPAMRAAYLGARQVWAPILGSALTTVVVFVPVLMLELPVGQLFRDIAVAISVSVLISVVVSITAIPALASRLLTREQASFEKRLSIPVVDHLARGFARLIIGFASIVVHSTWRGLVTVGILMTAAVMTLIALMPPLDYLPDGNQNFVFGRVTVPPGYTREATLEFAELMENVARPLWESDTPANGPPVDRFFFVAFNSGAFAGASTSDPDRVRELIPFLSEPIAATPGARVFVTQASLFGRSVGGSRSVNIDVLGPDLDAVIPVVRDIQRGVNRLFPRSGGHQVRVNPQLDSDRPEIVVRPDPEALARAGLNAREFAIALDVHNDGLRIREIPFQGELIELVLTADTKEQSKVEDIGNIPIVARQGELIRIDQVATVSIESAPDQVKRQAGARVLTVSLRLNESVPLEDAITQIQSELIDPLTAKGLGEGVRLELSGAAGELARTWDAMQINVLMAIAVIYLLLTVLLRSFVLPVIILVTVPIAATGGILGLWLVNLYVEQSLDMLTMLGFIILTGVVVNNAILMVEQTLWHIHHDHLGVEAAVLEATRNRIRPIFMSTMTSLFGLLPLIIFPGAGSELYRGIGVVVFGGLALSTLLTLVFVPPLLAACLRRSIPGTPVGDFDADESVVGQLASPEPRAGISV